MRLESGVSTYFSIEKCWLYVTDGDRVFIGKKQQFISDKGEFVEVLICFWTF